MAEIAHQFLELIQLRDKRRIVVAVELDDQQRVRFADQHPVDRRAEDRDAAAEIDHRAIDQFHRLGIELHDMLRRLHRVAECRELADAEQLARLDRLQRQFERGGEGERAFRTHQQPRQVLLPGEARDRRQHVDVVAADAAKLRGEARGDLLRLGGTERAQPLDQLGDAGGTSAPILSGSRPNLCCVPSARMASIARTLSAISP